METDQATKILARIGHLDYPICDQDIPGLNLSALEDAIDQAERHGVAWEWTAAERALDQAYRLLGAENPGTGYAWHIGRHPIQIERVRLDERYETEQAAKPRWIRRHGQYVRAE